jgi:hypothetical protein
MSEQGDINFQKQLLTLIYQEMGVSPSYAPYSVLNAKEDYLIFIVNGSIGLIQNWLKNGMNRSAKDMAETIYTLTCQVK